MASYTTTSNSSGNVWYVWNGGGTSSGDTTWSSWTDSSTSTVSYSSNQVWERWVVVTPDAVAPVTVNWPPPETEEQRQARLERERIAREAREQREREKEAARQKAEELLRENLDDEQREQFGKTKWFFVIGQSGRRYRIRRGWSGNIDELDDEDMIVATYCIHPDREVPPEDSMLVQKFMLECQEERLLEIANRRSVTPRPLAV